MSRLYRTGLTVFILTLTTLLLSGCVFGGEQAVDEMEPPKEVTYVKEGEALKQQEGTTKEKEVDAKQEKQTAEYVSRELYLFDQNGYVIPQTLTLPKTKEVAKQSLEYMVKDGPVSNMLPNGFQAVLPPGTEVLGLNLLDDGTLIADFSKEFTNYQPENEQKILQAITWTLTQFENIDQIKIRINGHDQSVMPVNGTPIKDGVSRADGINLDNGDVIDITDSKAVTLYFLSQKGDNVYYVPVTRRVDGDSTDQIASTVEELIKGPSYNSDLLTEFHPDMKLLEEPKYEDGVVTLNFNEAILGNLQGTAISDYIVNSLVLSLTEQEGVESVAIQVNGNSEVYNEAGDLLSKPVMRPQTVNTRSF